MTETLIKLVSKYLGKISFSEIEEIVKWIVDQEQTEKEGWKKLEEVMSQFDSKWVNRASWIVKTVCQLAFAIAKIRNIV
jgi:hypothetical protein